MLPSPEFSKQKEVISLFMTMIYAIYTLLYIFGGVIPYIPQYLKIKRTKSVKGFSTYVCLVLLVANILRICFWFVQPFSHPLLIQSVVIITGMLVVLQLAAKVISMEQFGTVHFMRTSQTNNRNICIENFWYWKQFHYYLITMILFTGLCGFITYCFAFSQIYIQLLGFTALFIEAMLGLPQFIKNFQNQSVKGMSLMMVIMWTIGDVCKTIYFVLEKAPIQFSLCGVLQILLDLAILLQYVYYRK